EERRRKAGKAGALAKPKGTMEVKWKSDGAKEAPLLVIEWRERDGPLTAEPSRKGFGVDFIELSVSYELKGTAELSFPSQGLAAEIRVPLSEVANGDGDSPI